MRPAKYRNIQVQNEHGHFDSRGEARRFEELKLLEYAGEITDLKRQFPIPLHGQDGPIRFDNGRRARLVVDFAYREDGEWCYEDYKGGIETPVSKLKRAVARAMGIEVRLSP